MLERLVEVGCGAAEDDVASPAAESRLEHEGQLGRRRRHPLRDQPRVRVRQAGEAESARGQQLVVRGDERGRAVEHLDAGHRHPLELERAALDAVEPLADVEPPQRDVSRLEDSQGVARGQHGCGDAQRLGGGGERLVRFRAPMGDDDEPHRADRAARPSGCGGRSGDASVSRSLLGDGLELVPHAVPRLDERVARGALVDLLAQAADEDIHRAVAMRLATAP